MALNLLRGAVREKFHSLGPVSAFEVLYSYEWVAESGGLTSESGCAQAGGRDQGDGGFGMAARLDKPRFGESPFAPQIKTAETLTIPTPSMVYNVVI